ncbi:hypothetical protein V3C99_016598, partial [Haemonchus contortus]
NLYTPADGLFGTHVTWEDCEENMQRELGTKASFGPNKTTKDIGDGNGFMSKMVLIDPDWQHKDKELPSRFVVKILTQLAIQKVFTEMSEMNNVKNSISDPKFMADMEEMQKVCHNAEVRTYEHLMKAPEEKMRIPKIYYMKMFTESNPLKGYIIMEYVDNIRPVFIYENISPRDVKQVLRHKAVMEAISLKIPIEERSKYTSPFQSVFKSMFEKEMLDQFMAMFTAFGGEKFADKCEHVKEILSDMVDLEWVDNMAEEFGMERVLCHGDLHSNNILWRKNGNDLDTVAVIDYQIAHFGCAATDLVRLFSGCLSGIDRRTQWEQLLEDFYGYLREEVNDSKMPYTLEQLKESYRQYFPIGAFMIVTVIGPFFELISKNSDGNLRKKGMDVVMEKTECLLDDIFFYHNRNMELRK